MDWFLAILRFHQCNEILLGFQFAGLTKDRHVWLSQHRRIHWYHNINCEFYLYSKWHFRDMVRFYCKRLMGFWPLQHCAGERHTVCCDLCCIVSYECVQTNKIKPKPWYEDNINCDRGFYPTISELVHWRQVSAHNQTDCSLDLLSTMGTLRICIGLVLFVCHNAFLFGGEPQLPDNLNLLDDPGSLLRPVRFGRMNYLYLKRDPPLPPFTPAQPLSKSPERSANQI